MKHYTYGYFSANNRHLTSFAASCRRRSFVQNVRAGTKNLKTTSLESAVRNVYKYQLIHRNGEQDSGETSGRNSG